MKAIIVKNDYLVKSGNLWCDITDHLPNFMLITGNSSTKCVENRPLVRLFSSNNIQKFCSLVHCIDWNDVYSNDDVDACYKSFETEITRCFEHSFPYIRLSRKRARDKKWITKGIKISIKHRNMLYKKWLTTQKDEDAVKYKNYRTTCKQVIEKAEHDYYKALFDNKSHSIKQLWRNLNSTFSLTKNKIRTSVSKITVNDITYTAEKDICNRLNDYFCDVGKNLASGISNQVHDFTKYCHVANNNSMFCAPASTAEILRIILCFKDNKAPGPDNIAPKLLKLISTDVLEPLSYIFNLSLSSGQVPQSLKIAKVIPLHKKGDKDKPGNYRPISLLSIFDKVLEKLMFSRLYSFIMQNDILYKYQFGFRKGFSTSLALIELLDTIYYHRDNHDFVIGMFFDLQKAFDTVDHTILLYKLENYGVRGIVLKWFHNYLSNRQQFVSIGNSKSDLHSVTYGVPQGSILGPLLFLLYINDIENSVHNATVKLFADDTNLFVHGKTLREAFDKANDCIILLHDWFCANRLSLSVEKSCYSVFGCDVSAASAYTISLGKINLNPVNCAKYLGIVIDSDLSWKSHIEYLFKKLLRFTGIFYKLRSKAQPNVLRMLYFTFVYPQLLYGIEVYANTCKSHLEKLVVLNNKLLRIAQNCQVRTCTVDLYKRYSTLPLPLLHEYNVLCFVHKCFYNSLAMPNVFNDYFQLNNAIHVYGTRSFDRLHLYTVNSSFGLKCIKFKGCVLWNSLPRAISDINSPAVFKYKLKCYLSDSMLI